MDRDLEQDFNNSEWFIAKVRAREDYAQNVYAALCNMRWQPADVFPILRDEYWSCSWRSAGGLVARLIGRGDYMDWYCSGIGDETPDTGRWIDRPKTYVPEGTVTDEIREDFAKLGWHPSEWLKDDE
jgi:hypothetical protein